MKHALIAATIALFVAGASQAQTLPRIVQANCSGCHGLDGNTNWQQIPRLAGQNADYMKAQLAAFAAAPTVHVGDMPDWLLKPATAANAARNDPDARAFMIGMSQGLGPEAASAATAWYSQQKPAPGLPTSAELASQGKAIFEHGIPAQGVLACSDCHGPQAQGLGSFPRLAGQHAGYLARQLRAFAAGSRGHGSAMTAQAKPLDSEQVEAVATYLQGLP